MSSTPEIETLAAKLRTAEGSAKLAEAWIGAVLDTELGALVKPDIAARDVHAMVSAFAHSPTAEAHVLARAEALCARFESEAQPLGRVLPSPVPEAAVKLARRQHQPHRQLVLRVLDREPVRQLIRSLLLEALVEFGRKLASPISGSRVGKGLGALGSIAGAVGSSVFGAVGGELEKQIERRATEFADGALSKVLGRVVDLVSNPRHAAEQAELRAALAAGLLEVPVREMVAEVRRADPKSLAATVRAELCAFADRPDARAELEREVAFWLSPVSARPLRSLLDELGVREAVERAAREQIIARAQQFDWASLFASL